jgi:D-aminopeptidase
MFSPQSSDHHQGSITVLVQLLHIGVHASSYSGMWLYVVCAYDVPVHVVSGYFLIFNF